MDPSDQTTRAHGSVTSDPRQIRALAHPIRLALLDYLGTVEQATATECAAALEESVASCSFHLRSLAHHGYIEPGERRGREKPWRKVFDSYTQQIDPAVPGSAAAVGAMAALTVTRETDRLRAFGAHLPGMHPDDVDLNVLSTSSFYATDEELADLRATLIGLAERFAGRLRNPEARPEGARLAHLFGALTLDPAGLRPADGDDADADSADRDGADRDGADGDDGGRETEGADGADGGGAAGDEGGPTR
ncbi:winged helix-turn-helix domain-containing protein [Zhihengliuella alba]